MKYAALIALLTIPLFGQSGIPGGLIYQAALQNGIDYVAPVSGQAIVNQKAALDWRKIGATLLTDGSLAIAGAGIVKFISIGIKAEAALVALHQFADTEVAPRLAAASPNPNDIAPVLQVGALVLPTPNSCVENSIYATSFPKGKDASAMLNGFLVTYSPQGVQVLKHIDGSKLKQFQVIDVLACLPPLVASATPIPAQTELRPSHKGIAVSFEAGAEYALAVNEPQPFAR